MQLSMEHQRMLLDVARQAVRNALAGQPLPSLPALPDPALMQPAGCFVTFHESGTHRLRGCIGRMQSEQPLIQTVQHTAVGALDDPRFTAMPVSLAELPRLELEISVLSPLAPAADPLDFDPPVHGIYLTCGDRTGVFLPQVARETGWTREELLSRLCTEKMGLSSFTWRHPSAKLQRFTVLIIGPEPFVVPEQTAR